MVNKNSHNKKEGNNDGFYNYAIYNNMYIVFAVFNIAAKF